MYAAKSIREKKKKEETNYQPNSPSNFYLVEGIALKEKKQGGTC